MSHPSAPAAFYVTFSGEKDKGGTRPIDNVVALDAEGRVVNDRVLRGLPDGVSLHVLRGLAFAADGTLYVANAHKAHSMILAFGPPGPDGSRVMVGDAPFARHGHGHDAAALVHPYGLAFDREHRLLVSVQDTLVVTCFEPDRRSAPVAHYLRSLFGHIPFLPGTLVAGGDRADHLPEPVPPAEGGLTKPRGIAYHADDHVLFVADETTRAVRSYDVGTGAFLGDLVVFDHHHGRPIGLHLDDRTLYVGLKHGDRVVQVDLDAPGAHRAVPLDDTVRLRHPAGLTIGGDGALYVASHDGGELIRHDLATGRSEVFASGFTDAPEHVIAVPPGFA